MQAFTITLEDMLIWTAKPLRIKNSAWTRVLGYVWVAAWFGWCTPGYINQMIRAGGGIREFDADMHAMDSNLVQAMLGLSGFDIGVFAESWFSKA